MDFSDGLRTLHWNLAQIIPQRALKIMAVSANALPDGLIRPMYILWKKPDPGWQECLRNCIRKEKWENGAGKQQFFLRFDPPFPYFDTEAPTSWNKGYRSPLAREQRDLIKRNQKPVDGWMYSTLPPGFDQGRDPSGIFQEEKSSTWKRS